MSEAQPLYEKTAHITTSIEDAYLFSDKLPPLIRNLLRPLLFPFISLYEGMRQIFNGPAVVVVLAFLFLWVTASLIKTDFRFLIDIGLYMIALMFLFV